MWPLVLRKETRRWTPVNSSKNNDAKILNAQIGDVELVEEKRISILPFQLLLD